MKKVALGRNVYLTTRGDTKSERVLRVGKPLSFEMLLNTAYAEQLLAALRPDLSSMSAVDCAQVSVDCPVSVVIDRKQTRALVAQLESWLSPSAATRSRRKTTSRRARTP